MSSEFEFVLILVLLPPETARPHSSPLSTSEYCLGNFIEFSPGLTLHLAVESDCYNMILKMSNDGGLIVQQCRGNGAIKSCRTRRDLT
jgi:hypothetical protein